MKIYELLSSLSNEETSLLNDFIISPIYNKNKEVVLYIQGVINLTKNKHLDTVDFDDTHLYAIIYPQTPFSRHKLWKLRSKSTELIDAFIIFLMQQKEDKDFYSILFYQERNLNTLAEKKIKEKEAILKDTRDTSITYYNDLYELCKSMHILQKSKKSIFLNFDLLIALVSSHEKSFAIVHAKCLLSLLIADIAGTQYPKISVFLNWAKNIDYTESDILSLYINTLSLMIETEVKEKEALYLAVKNSYLNIKDHLSSEIKFNIITCIINVCLRRASKTNIAPLKEAFVWWQYLLLDNDVAYAFSKIINANHYVSFMQIALIVKEFEFAQNFITQYSPYLPADSDKPHVLYYAAFLSFYQKKYTDTRDILIELENLPHNSHVIKLYVYMLWIKVYYEEENYNLVESYVNRLRVFNTRNHTISDDFIKLFNNFIIILNKLLKMKYFKQVSNANPPKIKELLILINDLPLLPLDYIWLAEKAEELYGTKKVNYFSNTP